MHKSVEFLVNKKTTFKIIQHRSSTTTLGFCVAYDSTGYTGFLFNSKMNSPTYNNSANLKKKKILSICRIINANESPNGQPLVWVIGSATGSVAMYQVQLTRK